MKKAIFFGISLMSLFVLFGIGQQLHAQSESEVRNYRDFDPARFALSAPTPVYSGGSVVGYVGEGGCYHKRGTLNNCRRRPGMCVRVNVDMDRDWNIMGMSGSVELPTGGYKAVSSVRIWQGSDVDGTYVRYEY